MQQSRNVFVQTDGEAGSRGLSAALPSLVGGGVAMQCVSCIRTPLVMVLRGLEAQCLSVQTWRMTNFSVVLPCACLKYLLCLDKKHSAQHSLQLVLLIRSDWSQRCTLLCLVTEGQPCRLPEHSPGVCLGLFLCSPVLTHPHASSSPPPPSAAVMSSPG